MAKLVLDDIGSTLTNTAATTINNNNNKIEQALENTLSRDGSTPNSMAADIDMDSNDILNVDNIHTNVLVLNGEVVQTVSLEGALKASNALSEIAVLGLQTQARDNIGASATDDPRLDMVFADRVTLSGAFVKGETKRVHLQYRDSTRVQGSDAVMVRKSFTSLSSYPTSAYTRSTDRFLEDGVTIDNTNGGYWLIDEDLPDPVQFGAKGDGVTDDQIAIVDAGTYAKARFGDAGGCVYFNSGAGYRWDATITTPNGTSWQGVTQIPMKYGGTGTALIMFGNGTRVNGFAFEYTGAFINTVTCIQIGISELAQRQVVNNNNFTNFNIAIYHKCSVAATIEQNIINNCNTYGILFENTVNPDAGDAAVYNNVISNSGLAPGTGVAAFRYHSGGGLRFFGNKLLSYQRGFDMQIPDGAATVDLMFTNNSIENQSVSCVRLGRSGTTGSFGSLTLSGSEFAGAPIGIDLYAGASNGIIIGNAFNLFSTAAIAINTAPNWQIDHNNYIACTANITDARPAATAEAISTTINGGFHVSDSTNYVYYFKVGVPDFRTAKIEVFFEGIVQGVGFTAREYQFMATNTGAAVAATVLKDQAVGAALDFNVDIASDTESFRFGWRRNAAGGGTTVDGTFTVRISGKIASVIRLA